LLNVYTNYLSISDIDYNKKSFTKVHMKKFYFPRN